MKTMFLITFLLGAGGTAFFAARVDREAPVAGATAADGFEAIFWVPGPTSGDVANGIIADSDGSMFIAGWHGGLDLDQDGTVDVTARSIDPLFMKLRPDGQPLWIRAPTGPKFEAAGRIALDRAGGVYGVGSYSETLSFSDGTRLRSTGKPDTYLVRYDAEGRVQWVRTMSSDSLTVFRDVASDAQGNAYVVATARGSSTLDGHKQKLSPRDESVQLVASYDRNGGLRWVWPHLAAAGWSLHVIDIAPGGHVYVVGWFRETVDFDDDGRPEFTAQRGAHAFVARFTAEGRFLRAWRMTGVQAGDKRGGLNPVQIAFARNGDVVLTGTLLGPVDFDDDGKPDADVRGGGERSAFLARYSSEGRLRWARSYPIDSAWDVATDGDRFAVAGFYEDERDLNEDGVIDKRDGILYPLAKKRRSEWAVVVTSGEGKVLRLWTAPGPGNDQARAAAFTPNGSAIYVAGFIQLTADFTGDRTFDEGGLKCDALGDLVYVRYALDACPLDFNVAGRRDGQQRIADLTWTGTTSARVEIHRNGKRLAIVPNNGAYSDPIPTSEPDSLQYVLFEGVERGCRDTVVVRF